MATRWSMADYAMTDALYHSAALRGGVARAVLLAQWQDCLPARDRAGLRLHLGQLTEARAALGLPVLPYVNPAVPAPRKLRGFLRRKYAG